MFKIIKYAHLAMDVYGPFKIPTFVNTKSISPDFTGVARILDVDPTMIPGKPFYAQLYVKFSQGRAVSAVVAVRGTVPEIFDNLKKDLFSWWSDVAGEGGFDIIPGYMAQAFDFYRRSRDYVAKYFPSISKVKLTGHVYFWF